jgi:Holliday junction resolvase-like predicted endonuclease
MKIAKDLRFYKGLLCELIACIILIIKGYKVLKWNYKNKATAQIDIVVIKNDVIRLVEVKYRKNIADAIDSISYSQQKRLKSSIYYFEIKYKKSVVIDGFYFGLNKPYFVHNKNIF